MSQHLDTSLHTDLTDVRISSLRSIRTDPAHSPLHTKKLSGYPCPARFYPFAAKTPASRDRQVAYPTYVRSRSACPASVGRMCGNRSRGDFSRSSIVRRTGGDDRSEAPSGTDRVAEVARGLTDVDIIVNVQGDEPELAGESIDLVIKLLEDDRTAVMATLATPIRNRHQWEDPACVKVVFDHRGKALYFSRSPIPYPRQMEEGLFYTDPPKFYQHVGLYAYRRDFLLKLAAMPPSPLEKLEKLEQLRVLEAGYSILVGVVDEPTFGIDTPEDYRAFVEKYSSRSA